jgi:hypothetical protein
MKKLKAIAASIILPLLFGGIPLKGIDLGLKFSGGYAYLDLRNTNRSLQDWAAWRKREAEANKNWEYLGNNVINLHSGIDFEGEFLVSFLDRFEIGLGAGYIYGDLGNKEAEVSIQRVKEPISHAYPLTLSAHPLFLSAYYFFPLKSGISLYIRASGGAAWIRYVNREAQKLESSAKYNYFRLEKAAASGSMFVGGFGLSCETKTGIRFFIEGSARRAKIRGLSGENEEGEKGILYQFEEYIPELDFWQTKNEIRTEKPSGSNYRSVSEALIDFSGFSVKIGFRISF